MAEGDAIPTKRETEQQVERMLASKVFSSRPRQADLFRFLITSALAGVEISEKDIRAAFFPTPPYNPLSTIARTTVNLVRELISAYYAAEGKDDLVVIEFPKPGSGLKQKKIKQPPGKAYRPTVSYNPRSESHKRYLLGVHLLSQCTSTGNFYAEDHFRHVLGENPDHLAAHLGLATIHLREAICRDGAQPSRKSLLLKAEKSVREALRINPDSWNAHAILGAIHCCRWQWGKAEAEFTAALKADRTKTCYESWYYAAYLAAIGRRAEAIEFTASRAAAHPDEPLATTAHGILLYALRDYSAAFRALSDARQASADNWLAELFLGLLHMEEPNPIEYVNDDLSGDYSRALQWVNKAREHMQPYRFPGITVLAASREGKPAITERLLSELDGLAQKEHISSLDRALVNLADDDRASAIRSLSEARADDDPLLAWLHLWPLLDPLRTRPAFRALVKRMQLPIST
jgi:tetratricopeptide (TPR) repeat protein